MPHACKDSLNAGSAKYGTTGEPPGTICETGLASHNSLPSTPLLFGRISPARLPRGIFRAGLSLFLGLSLILAGVPSGYAGAQEGSYGVLATTDEHAMQAADILGIRLDVERLLKLQRQAGARGEKLVLQGRIYRSIMRGVCEVRAATNKIEREQTYTYDLWRHQLAKEQTVSDYFNLLYFVQFGVLYSLEGLSRLKDQFVQSAILTAVGSGVGISLPTMNILYDKIARARDVAPPEELAATVQGSAVTDIQLPDLITKFLDTPAPELHISRRQQMYELWRVQYGTDAMAKQALYSLLDGKSKSAPWLYKRIVHLWSLHTFVQDFDHELLALMRLMQSFDSVSERPSDNLAALGIGPGGRAAARLLNIEQEVAERISLNRIRGSQARRQELETYLVGRILYGSLEMRAAQDKIYEELHYAYDVVLAQLESRRAKQLQLVYEASFTQINTFGAIASIAYLKGQSKTGNELFIVGDSLGIALPSLSLLLRRGGNRKIDTPPNSLAGFFDLSSAAQYQFSPFVTAYLHSVDPSDKDGRTHKEALIEVWKQHKVSTLNVNERKVQEKLAAMSSVKNDTIQIVSNRVRLLDSLRVRLQLFDQQLLEIIKAIRRDTGISTPGNAALVAPVQTLDKAVLETAELLGVKSTIERISSLKGRGGRNEDLIDYQLDVTREILAAMLEVRRTSAQVELEIADETFAMDRLIRYRDLANLAINLGNFYQIGILGVIIDGPLGLSSKPREKIIGNRMTIVSGLTTIGLASFVFLLRRGGIRLKGARPNMLGPAFSIDSSATGRFSPLVLKYLDDVDPRSPKKSTRRQELIEYWRHAQLLPVTIKDRSTAEKVSATGKSHHWWNEGIKLLRTRITMLFDLRSMVNLMESDFAELLKAID
ncbi:MAG: hypothetical protein HY711_09740 [Candidatus Melainabacteria bacterium]|nr:hypothetical protein [Candidatus Melainabacteria bacterium]